jgi:hypothetical protein
LGVFVFFGVPGRGRNKTARRSGRQWGMRQSAREFRKPAALTVPERVLV